MSQLGYVCKKLHRQTAERPKEQESPDTFQMAGGTAKQESTLNPYLVWHPCSWLALLQVAANYKTVPPLVFIAAIQKAAGSNRIHIQFSFCCYLG